MTKRIIQALSILSLILGSLACFMQSAPSTLAHLPTKPATQPAQSITEASTELTCEVNTHALNVRDCAGFECSIVGWLEAGWTVKAERSSGSAWIKITRGNLSGFARADYLNCK